MFTEQPFLIFIITIFLTRMNNFFFATTFLLVSFFTVFYSPFSSAQQPAIILGRATDKSVTASILCSKNTAFYIRYGRQSGVYTDVTENMVAEATIPIKKEIPGLLPDTRYYYTLLYQPEGTNGYISTPEYTFHTQRAPGSSFTVVIEADEHLYDKKGVKSLYEITLQNQAKDKPDLMFTLGDTFGDDRMPDEITDEDMKQLHLDYIPFLSKICHSIPFYFCLGNHEGENGYYLKQNNGNNLCVYGTRWRKYYYPNPYPDGFYTGNMTNEGFGIGFPENYYAFVWGDAHFIVLDVYRDSDVNVKPQKWDWTLGEAQYQWFKKTLETSTSKFKFVLAHHTRGQGRGGVTTSRGYEWGGYNGDNGNNYEFDNYRPGWGLPIHQLMVKHGVNIYFQGHDHLYAREESDGIVYQEAPMACDSTYEIGVLANSDAYEGVILKGSGHLRLQIDPSCVTVDFIRAFLPKDTLSGENKNAEVAYSYSIGNCASGSDDSQQNLTSLEVFPNPAQQSLHVRFPVKSSFSGIVELIDFNGNILKKSDVSANQDVLSMDTSELLSGLYWIKYKHPGGVVVKKIIIQH